MAGNELQGYELHLKLDKSILQHQNKQLWDYHGWELFFAYYLSNWIKLLPTYHIDEMFECFLFLRKILKECQISGSKWFARSNKVEAEGSQCSRDAHCVGARSLFWVVCTVHCTDWALCIEQIVHSALNGLCTVLCTDFGLCIAHILDCAFTQCTSYAV